MVRPRILLVDDDRRVRQLVGLTLPADDYELSFAEDGMDAIIATKQLNPDLILLDYAMPGLHGVDVCKAIRSDPSSATTPIIMLTGHGDDEIRERSAQAGASGFLTKPFSPLALEETIRSMLGASDAVAAAPAATSARKDAPAVRTGIAPVSLHVVAPNPEPPSIHQPLALLQLPRDKSSDRLSPETSSARDDDRHDTLLSTVEALATAIELRGAEAEGHAQRLGLFTVAAARAMRLDPADLEQLRWGAILHDVGMICVPDAILRKTDNLHPDEWALIRRHPNHGASLLSHIPGLGVGMSIVRFHHERFDGAGYPLGLRGTAIPLGARIFAVADALDAITTDRPYRPRRTWDQARIEILQGRGSHFDPTVVDAFLEIFDELQGLTAAEAPYARFD